MKTNGTPHGRGKRLSTEQRRQLLDQFERKAVSAEAFAARHGIGVSTLYHWQRLSRRNKAQARPLALREISLGEVMGKGSRWSAELQLPDGTCLRWNDALPASALSEVLHTLRRSC